MNTTKFLPCLIMLSLLISSCGSKVGAFSEIRMMTSDDPEGSDQRTFPSGTTTLWLAFNLTESRLNADDTYAVKVLDASGKSYAQINIVENGAFGMPTGARVIMGGQTSPHKIAIRITSESGVFPDGEYHLEIIINGEATTSIRWSVGP